MIEQIRRLIVGLALAGVSSCGGVGPPPGPVPTPTPAPVCMPDVPWCSDTGQTCSSPSGPCKHNPTADPNHCELAAPCPPGPTPTPTPTPTPPPGTGCVLSGAGVFLGTIPQPVVDGQPLGWHVNQAMSSLIGCPVGSRCVVTARPQVWQAAVEAELRKRGFCAGQHEPGTDEIAVAVALGKPMMGYHIYAGDGWDDPTKSGTIVWSPGADRPAYAPPGGVPGPTPTPAPTPGPVPGCSAPLPPQVWTAETLPPGFDPALVGHTRYVMTCRAHGNVVDCTAQNQRACDYCAAIGMGEIGGQIRCGCPVRNECLPAEQIPPQNFKCEERVACEAYLTGGTVLESRNGATCELVGGNPFVFRPNDGNCRLCGANGTIYNGQKQGCGAWF